MKNLNLTHLFKSFSILAVTLVILLSSCGSSKIFKTISEEDEVDITTGQVNVSVATSFKKMLENTNIHIGAFKVIDGIKDENATESVTFSPEDGKALYEGTLNISLGKYLLVVQLVEGTEILAEESKEVDILDSLEVYSFQFVLNVNDGNETSIEFNPDATTNVGVVLNNAPIVTINTQRVSMKVESDDLNIAFNNLAISIHDEEDGDLCTNLYGSIGWEIKCYNLSNINGYGIQFPESYETDDGNVCTFGFKISKVVHFEINPEPYDINLSDFSYCEFSLSVNDKDGGEGIAKMTFDIPQGI